MTHTGNFTQGEAGAMYNIIVTNSGNWPTTAVVSVSDSVPTGLTASAIAGAGWTCVEPSGPCTRNDVLNDGGSYPTLILTVSVANNAGASVTNVVTVSGGGEIKTSNDAASDPTSITAAVAGAPISDDFSSSTLNTALWTFVNSRNDASYSVNGSTLQLSVPAGVSHDVWTDGENGVRVMQSVADADFEVEVKFNSTVNPSLTYQEEGIIVEQDSSDFLRFSIFSSAQQTILFAASCLGPSATVWVNQAIRGGPSNYMRVKRTGKYWQFTYSYDSIHWTPSFAFTQDLSVARIGPYAGNSGFNGAPAPAFTAVVDHFTNRLSPPVMIDGIPYPPPAPPTINVWYGDTQTFGQNGLPQEWVNILGDVSDYNQISTLTYTLNGGSPQTLWMGENEVRLASPGDYNVEIDYTSLAAGVNTVSIQATDTAGRQTTHTVTINYVTGQSWPKNYSINWSAAPNIESVSQVVDGVWQIQPGGTVKPMVTGYDRLITIGDKATWVNYVVNAEVTLNSVNGVGFAVGIIAGWQGHTTMQYGQPLPDQPRTGHPFPGAGLYSMGSSVLLTPTLNIYENTPSVPEHIMTQDNTGRTLQLGVKYIFKFQAQQNNAGGSHYSFKVWPAASPEPQTWDLEADGETSLGSIGLVAHEADVSFGAITIAGL